VLTAPWFSFKKKTSRDTQNQMFRVRHLTGHTYHIYGSKQRRLVNIPVLASSPTLVPINQGEDDTTSNFIIVEDKE
jgi:hypothetical protein